MIFIAEQPPLDVPAHGCTAGRRVVEDFDTADDTRFLSRLTLVGDCWVYGDSTRNEYARFRYKGRTVAAHRFAYVAYGKGSIPRKAVVSHSCDRKNCVNPDHLWATTQRVNVIDAYRKGHIRPYPRGSAHPNARLNEHDVEEIRRRYQNGESQRALATEFGVQVPAISRIVNYKRHRRPSEFVTVENCSTIVRDDWISLMVVAAARGLESLGYSDEEILKLTGRLNTALDAANERAEAAA